MSDWIYAVILGVVEGLTEFIPVSSTGMLLLTKQALGLTDVNWDTFIVLIQLGAILAVVVLYFSRLWNVVLRLPSDPRARRFAQIHAKVQSVRLISAFYDPFGPPGELHHLARGSIGDTSQPGHMPIGSHHQVTARIWIPVEDHEAVLSPMNH